MTPIGAKIRNPAFDVTPYRYITGIVTERGILRPPYSESLKQAFTQLTGA
jgi:methylthioribose-1-phosphate isomerase